jgi:hypothetical protein
MSGLHTVCVYVVRGGAGGTPAAPSLTSAGGSVSGTQADPGAGPPRVQGGPHGWTAPVEEEIRNGHVRMRPSFSISFLYKLLDNA